MKRRRTSFCRAVWPTDRPRTVLRAGFGMFAGFLGERRGDVQQNGFTQNTNMVLTTDNGLTWDHPRQALPQRHQRAERQRRWVPDLPGPELSRSSTRIRRSPLTMRWELGLSMSTRVSFETDYVGSKSNHIEISTGGATRSSAATSTPCPYQYWSKNMLRGDAWNNYLTGSIANPITGGTDRATARASTPAPPLRGRRCLCLTAFGSNNLYTSEHPASPGITISVQRPEAVLRRAAP